MLQCYIFERARIQRLTVFQMLHPGENLHRTCMLGMVDVCALFLCCVKNGLERVDKCCILLLFYNKFRRKRRCTRCHSWGRAHERLCLSHKKYALSMHFLGFCLIVCKKDDVKIFGDKCSWCWMHIRFGRKM